MATYTIKAVESVRATKETKGVVGISLSYNEKRNTLRATVDGTSVYLYETTEGKAAFSARDFSRYESESEAYKARDLDNAQRYLIAKYSITQKSFSFLRDLARQGKALLTKAEAKALRESEKATA